MSTTSLVSIPKNFDWPLAFDGEKLIRERLEDFLIGNNFARQLAARMYAETGTDFFEWVDHLIFSPDDETALVKAGFVRDAQSETPNGEIVLEHPQATLPRVLLRRGESDPFVVAIKPEFVAEFIAANNIAEEPEGLPRSRYRRVVVAKEGATKLIAVERRAYRGFTAAEMKPGELEAIARAEELLATRPRRFSDDCEGFSLANQRLDQAIELVGRDIACHLFFEAERAFWESRNRAARLQKFRQDALGLGWGNHDHHTYRSSRERFVDLVHFLDKLGFQRRERYYAGAEAGWGAQISEQPVTGIVIFADVDLMPDEREIDFSAEKLALSSKLGTVGLWTGLHGESFLSAGMHHLEARFDFATLTEQLQTQGVKVMKPFSNFEFLRQAFTEGERWPVDPQRVERLAAANLITREQADVFLRDGAIGSHLENLQRHGGFKGFNQKAVSVIIAATDPRKQPAH